MDNNTLRVDTDVCKRIRLQCESKTWCGREAKKVESSFKWKPVTCPECRQAYDIHFKEQSKKFRQKYDKTQRKINLILGKPEKKIDRPEPDLKKFKEWYK